MPVKNSSVLAKNKLNRCRDINSLLNWLSDCGGDFLEALENHKQVRLLLDYNVYNFRENEFNSIVYQLDEIERDLKILYRKTKIIENSIGNMPSDMPCLSYVNIAIDLLIIYDNFQIKWKKIWDKIKNKLTVILNYVLK